jgi:peptidyl-prolyl cis-trans isomerase SurA
MKRLLSAVLITVIATAPAWGQKKLEQIVARVGTKIILKSDLDRHMENLRAEIAELVAQKRMSPEDGPKELEESRRNALRDLIDRSLVVQLAEEFNETADVDVFKAMEQLRTERNFATMEDLEKAIMKDYGDVDEFKNDIRSQVLFRKVIESEVYRHIVITQEEERKYYEEHKEEFNKPAGVRLSAIVVLVDRRLPDQVAVQRKKAEEALAAIKKGDDFADVARKYSEVPEAADGGDMGYIEVELADHIKKAVENLAKNQTTEIVEAPDGAFEIYKVTDKHSGGILSYDLAERFIYSRLMERAAPPKIREFLTRLREDGFVEVKEGFTDEGAAKPKVKASASAKP